MTPEFDDYTISRVLGEGGMGLVYLASDRRTGLPVAIKVMSGREFDSELRARFLKENRILSALNHRNIVRCYEITQSRDGLPSIVMEYVDGVDVRAFEGRPYPELLPLMIQALMGLAYLRSQNILHRDLSSNNVFVTLENDTRVTKILDFGVAKILQERDAEGDVKTRTGQFLGKFAFASPEHFSAAGIDWRSDVYSLGVIFHRLLTKQAPITVARKGNYYDWLVAHGTDQAFEIAAPAGVPPLPEALRSIVRRMLAKRPDDRPQSYEEIIHVMDRIQRGLPPALEPDPLELRTLPPAVEGRIGSSEPRSATPSPRSGRFFRESREEEPAPPAEESQQRRWPDLEAGQSHTERFVAHPSPPAPPPPAPPPVSPPPAASKTELLPSPVPSDATVTGPTIVTGRPKSDSEVSSWKGGAATDVPAQPLAVPPAVSPTDSSRLLEEKTERLDDVIEKLRQQAVLGPLPPVKPMLIAEPPDPEPAPPRKGQRLVVYGDAAPPAPPVPAAPVAAAPRPATSGAPALGPADRRTRGIVIGLIVGAIIVLFAAVLWVLIFALRGAPAGPSPRSSSPGPAETVAAANPSIRPNES